MRCKTFLESWQQQKTGKLGPGEFTLIVTQLDMRDVGTKTNETWFACYLDTSSLSCEFPCLSLSSSSSNKWERLLKWHISSESSPEKNLNLSDVRLSTFQDRCLPAFFGAAPDFNLLKFFLHKIQAKFNMTWNIKLVPRLCCPLCRWRGQRRWSLGTRLLKHS